MYKKKVGIITLYGDNYGNRLQNYAVHKILTGLGYDSETIVCEKKKTIQKKIKSFAKKCVMKFLPKFLMLKLRPNTVRVNNFKKFTQKNIPTRYIQSQNALLTKEFSKNYDFFVVGSDQVWNPTFEFFKNEYQNLLMSFVPSEKRYCISPSLGVDHLPNEWEPVFANELKQYVNLCAREETGTKIIKELTGREDVVTTIDPTLMLDSSAWLEVSKEVKGLKEKYVLDYFLGETPLNDENYLHSTNENNGERIKLLDKTNPQIYISGPAEFIYLISRASLICTDSFHACVFAILFSKPFKVFKRKDENKDMFSRIDTLLGMFGVNSSESVGKTIFVSPEIRESVLNIKRKNLIEALKLK